MSTMKRHFIASLAIAVIVCMTAVLGGLPDMAGSFGSGAIAGQTACAAAKKKSAKLPRLSVEGNHLVNAKGKTVQLKGISTHGLAWFPQYVNKEAFKTLKKKWGANVIRLAMYTEEYGGYLSGGDKAALEAKIDEGVTYATQLGMYVIIDWHILSDNNPNAHIEESKAFFDKMTKKYKDHTNVLYEICNEPHEVSWHNDIKPYAQTVIQTIRANDKNAVVIVGTNTWSQDVDDVIGDRLDDKNTVYTLHFYAATHGDFLRDKMKKAMDAGIPVFISECSICDASGNGGIDKASADAWFSLIDQYKVSYVVWNLSNKNETSALIKESCTKTSGWKKDDLSETGQWFKKQMNLH